MIILLKKDRIFKELDQLHNNRAMQRDFIRCLVNGGQNFFFLNCYRMECNYLELKPIYGLPKTWKVKSVLKDNIERLYKAGFLNETEKGCCEAMVREVLYVLDRHKLFLFLYMLFHRKKKARG